VKDGITGRFWCYQDLARRKKAQPSSKDGVQPRETLGPKRFECQSELRITCTSDGEAQALRITLSHSQNHTPYFDVSFPPEAVDIIRDNISWALPNIIGKVQSQYPRVTGEQVTDVWAKFATNRNNEGEQDATQDAHNPVSTPSE